MRFNTTGNNDGPGWIFGVLILIAATARTVQLLLAGEYGTVIGYAFIGGLLLMMVMMLSVLSRGMTA